MANDGSSKKRDEKESAKLQVRKKVTVQQPGRTVEAEQDVSIDLEQEEEDSSDGPVPNGNGNGNGTNGHPSNVKVLAESASVAAAHLFVSLTHSLGLGFESAVDSQSKLALAARAASLQGVSRLLTLPGAEQASAASAISASGLTEFLAALEATRRDSRRPIPPER